MGRAARILRDARGVTLAELAVTLTIIGVLSAVIVAGVTGTTTSANESAKAQLFASVQQAVDSYSQTHLPPDGAATKATYPFQHPTGAQSAALGTVRLTSTGAPDKTAALDETRSWDWYGPTGKALSPQPGTSTAGALYSDEAFVYVDLYSGGASCAEPNGAAYGATGDVALKTDLRCLGFLKVPAGAAKAFGTPGTSGGSAGKVIRCLFVSNTQRGTVTDPNSGNPVTVFGTVVDGALTAIHGGATTTSGVSTEDAARAAVGAATGRILACRDADPGGTTSGGGSGTGSSSGSTASSSPSPTATPTPTPTPSPSSSTSSGGSSSSGSSSATPSPSPGVWTSKASMSTARNVPAVEAIGSTAYVAGGWNGFHRTVLEAYDTVSGTWTTKASMPVPQSRAASGVINGVLYVAGGTNCCVETNTFTKYDPATDTWTTLAAMPSARQGAAGGVINGKLYVAGGINSQGSAGVPASPALEAFDASTGTWTSLAPLPAGRAMVAGAVINGNFYVVGGFTGINSAPTTVGTLESYNPATNTWSTKAPMPTARQELAAAVVNGVLYAIGGLDASGALSSAVEKYDPATDTWSAAPSLPAPRAYLRASASGGVIYADGGNDPAGVTARNEAFTPTP